VLQALVEAGHHVRLVVGLDDGHVAAPCAVDVVPALASRTGAEAPDLDVLASTFAPDLIHVHTVMNPAVLEWAAARHAVITVQDHRYFCPTRGKWTAGGHVCTDPMRQEGCAACFDDQAYFREVYALTAARLSAIRQMRIVVLSRYMKKELVDVGVPHHRVTVVPPFVHGLDPEARPDGSPCILFVGRLTETKGVLDAIEAWRLSGLALPLVVAGSGPLRAAAREAGGDVRGWLDRARLAAAYKCARALIMPSRWQEPFGIAGLEALTMGVPVAAWRSGGVAEWHPGEGLVPWGDIPGLAAALRGAVGLPAAAPHGFDRASLMTRLMEVYGVGSSLTTAAAGLSVR
jgi:glycosyltransferase involved in cell wall biosynthesis